MSNPKKRHISHKLWDILGSIFCICVVFFTIWAFLNFGAFIQFAISVGSWILGHFIPLLMFFIVVYGIVKFR